MIYAKDRTSGDVVGYAYVDLAPVDAAFLCSVCVVPARRRDGIGRTLVAAAKRLAQSRGHRALALTIRPPVDPSRMSDGNAARRPPPLNAPPPAPPPLDFKLIHGMCELIRRLIHTHHPY